MVPLKISPLYSCVIVRIHFFNDDSLKDQIIAFIMLHRNDTYLPLLNILANEIAPSDHSFLNNCRLSELFEMMLSTCLITLLFSLQALTAATKSVNPYKVEAKDVVFVTFELKFTLSGHGVFHCAISSFAPGIQKNENRFTY